MYFMISTYCVDGRAGAVMLWLPNKMYATAFLCVTVCCERELKVRHIFSVFGLN